MISALSRLPDGTIELTITIPWSKIKAAYDQNLATLAKTAVIKGFRQGKAPLKVVEQSVDQNQLYEQALKKILPQTYADAVKEHQVKPMISPEVSLTKLEKNKDWQVVAKTCELPAIKLGDYRAKVRQALAKNKIWTPDKAKQTEDKKDNPEDKTAKVFTALLASIKFSLPQILIDQEVNRMLSRLLDQANQLGLTIEQYLQSTGKTQVQLRQEYQQQAEQTMRLELILSKIADEEKVTVNDAEVAKMIAAVPDEKSREGLKNQTQQAYIRQILRKRKVIDNLVSL